MCMRMRMRMSMIRMTMLVMTTMLTIIIIIHPKHDRGIASPHDATSSTAKTRCGNGYERLPRHCNHIMLQEPLKRC